MVRWLPQFALTSFTKTAVPALAAPTPSDPDTKLKHTGHRPSAASIAIRGSLRPVRLRGKEEPVSSFEIGVGDTSSTPRSGGSRLSGL